MSGNRFLAPRGSWTRADLGVTARTSKGAVRGRVQEAAMPEDEAPPRRQGRQAVYPGKLEFRAADQRLRRALSRLARDPDPAARQEGARIVEKAIEALHALAGRADAASSATKRIRAETERLSRRLDAALARRGRPDA
jgi:hypothetical protein